MEEISTVGPVEWVALTFNRAAIGRRVIPPLTEPVDSGTVRLPDAVVLHGDADGVMTAKVETKGAVALHDLVSDALELLSDERLIVIGGGRASDLTTVVLVQENRWAVFAEVVRRAGGVLAEHERTPADRADAALGSRAFRMRGTPW